MVARLRISFGLIDDVYARPMILVPCQNPRIAAFMPISILCFTWRTKWKWSGIIRSARICISGWWFGIVFTHSFISLPNGVNSTLACSGSLSGMTKSPNIGFLLDTTMVMWYIPTPFHAVSGSCQCHCSSSLFIIPVSFAGKGLIGKVMIAFDSGATHRCFRRFANEPFARQHCDLPVSHQ